jgi:DNA-binding NarL/FixJ family response regulator
MTVSTSFSNGPAGRISLLMVDDHPIVRAGLRELIADHPDLVIAAEAENGERAVARFRDVRPDVTLMDLRMPVMGGLEAIKRIRAEFPQARIIALTTYDGDADIRRALSAGARGYLMKDNLPTEV